MTTIETTTRRDYPRPALMTGLLAAAALLVLNLVHMGSSILVYLQAAAQGGMQGDVIGSVLQQASGFLLSAVLAMALALFLTFWLIAPITPEQKLSSVLGRSVVAVVVYGFLRSAIVFGAMMLSSLQFEGGFFGYAFPGLSSDRSVSEEIIPGLHGAITSMARGLPLVVLAGVLLWIWLQRHPLAFRESDASSAV